MKRMLVFVMLLALMPLTATGLEHYIDGRFTVFPEMDELYGRFDRAKNWTVVTPETLDEHWELVSARGDTEEEIRARYADENFLFEAYSTDLTADACVRGEVYENDFTRDVWHLRHWNTAERKKLNNHLMSGKVLTDRDVYKLVNAGSHEGAYVWGYYTNYPPATHESGKLRIDFRNGRMYVLSYCVSGRLAGASRWYSGSELKQFNRTPVYSTETKYRSECLPRLPKYELSAVFPEDVAPGTVTVKGSIEAGSTMAAALDGQELPVKVDKKNNFTVELPLMETGERKVVFTVSNKKFTTRTMEYTVNVSDTLTPLTITGEPDMFSTIGNVKIAGQTAPGAAITVVVNDGEPAVLTADEKGGFIHEFKAEERGVYTVRLTAAEEGKMENSREIAFAADYADTNAGIKAYAAKVTDVKFKTICENVEEYVGEKVKISIRTKKITLNEQGLGLLCVYNAPSGKKEDQTLLYVNLPGYAQCQIGENMIITIYAVVDGKRVLTNEKGEEEERVELTAEYGTYLVARKR